MVSNFFLCNHCKTTPEIFQLQFFKDWKFTIQQNNGRGGGRGHDTRTHTGQTGLEKWKQQYRTTVQCRRKPAFPF